MTDKIFADGLFFKKPSEKAPSFIIGNLSVNVEKFTKFIQEQQTERGWVNLDIKESRNGTIYVELNTYKREEKSDFQNKLEEPAKEEIPVIQENDEVDIKNIPF
jgi:hypothetical protein